jgi:hypothetical protein
MTKPITFERADHRWTVLVRDDGHARPGMAEMFPWPVPVPATDEHLAAAGFVPRAELDIKLDSKLAELNAELAEANGIVRADPPLSAVGLAHLCEARSASYAITQQRIAEYKASEVIWRTDNRAHLETIRELTEKLQAAGKQIGEAEGRQLLTEGRLNAAERELEATREKLRTALNWDAGRKVAYVQFANAIGAISKQQVPHPLRGAIGGVIEALDATLIANKDPINVSQPSGHAPNECPECDGTGNVVGKSGCSACGGSGSSAPRHTCRPDDLSAYCEACQAEEDAEMRAHGPCLLCPVDPCVCDVLTYGNAPSVLGREAKPKAEDDPDAAAAQALRVLIGNVCAYAGELPSLVSTIEPDWSELLHHAGHIEYELSEIREVLRLKRERGFPAEPAPSIAPPDDRPVKRSELVAALRSVSAKSDPLYFVAFEHLADKLENK